MEKSKSIFFFLAAIFTNISTHAYQCAPSLGGGLAVACDQVLLEGGNDQPDEKYEVKESRCEEVDQPMTGKRKASCSSQITKAVNKAGDAVMNEITEKSFIAVEAQTKICNENYEAFQSECSLSKVQDARELIVSTKQSIEDHTSQLVEIQTQLDNENKRLKFEPNESFLSDLYDKAVKLKTKLESATAVLAEQKEFIETFKNVCSEKIEHVRTVCVDPQYGTVGERVHINLFTTNQTRMMDQVQAVRNEQDGDAEATVRVVTSGTFIALEAEDTKSRANSAFRHTTEQRRDTVITLGLAESTARDSGVLAQQVISTLQPLFGRNDQGRANSDCDAEVEDCSTAGNPSGPAGNTTNFALGQPVQGDSASRSSEKANTGDRQSNSVTADQISQNASNLAYGAPGGSSPTSPAAGSGSPTSGVNGFMGGLNSLGSLFGKTNGGFGTDSSYASARSPLRGGRNSNDQGGFTTKMNSNSQSYDRTRTHHSSKHPGNTSDQNSFATRQGSESAGPAGFNGSNSGSFSADRSSDKSDATEKPGLLNRILGRSKDKTLFGKRSASSGPGYGTSRHSSRSGLNTPSMDKSDRTNKFEREGQARVFDASKYAPSKEAQARAYARATGRKIASNTGDTINSGFEWPKDISTDKNGNIFRKAGLSVRVSLSK